MGQMTELRFFLLARLLAVVSLLDDDDVPFMYYRPVFRVEN